MKINLKVSILLYLIVFVVYIFLYFSSFNIVLNKEFSILVVIINFLSIIIFFNQKERIKKLKGQYIRINTFFIIAYFIVFFQLHIDYILDNFSINLMRFWVNLSIVLKALMISSLGLISYLLGYSIKKLIGDKKKYKKERADYSYSLLGYNILSASLLLGFIVTVNPLYLYGGYGIFEIGSGARYFSILFELSITAGLVQHILNLRNEEKTDFNIIGYIKSLGLFKLLLLFIYCLMILISGDRGPIIYIGLGVFSSFVILTKYKVSLTKFIGLIFIASILVSTLVVLRNSTDDNRSVVEKLIDGFFSDENKSYESIKDLKSISNTTLELATSIRTLHNAVNIVPEKHDYFYGQFQALQIVTIIPLGQLAVQDIFDLKDTELTSEKYVSDLAGAKNGSEGTSCVADIYLDFGLLGVIVIMYLFGFYVRSIEVEIFLKEKCSRLIIITFIIFTQYAIYIPRSTIMFNVRNIIWISLMMTLINLFSKKVKKYNI